MRPALAPLTQRLGVFEQRMKDVHSTAESADLGADVFEAMKPPPAPPAPPPKESDDEGKLGKSEDA